MVNQLNTPDGVQATNVTLHEQLRVMLNEVKNLIDSQGVATGYFERARDKVVSAIDAIDADERCPPY